MTTTSMITSLTGETPHRSIVDIQAYAQFVTLLRD